MRCGSFTFTGSCAVARSATEGSHSRARALVRYCSLDTRLLFPPGGRHTFPSTHNRHQLNIRVPYCPKLQDLRRSWCFPTFPLPRLPILPSNAYATASPDSHDLHEIFDAYLEKTHEPRRPVLWVEKIPCPRCPHRHLPVRRCPRTTRTLRLVGSPVEALDWVASDRWAARRRADWGPERWSDGTSTAGEDAADVWGTAVAGAVGTGLGN